MRNAISLFLILAISCTFSGCSKSRSFNELVLKDGIYYLKESTKPYSGKILERFPSGEDSLKARITNGVLDGDYTTYYKSGAVRDSMIYKTDTLIRKKSWNENGSRLLIPRSSLIIDKDWRCFLKTPDGKQITFSGLTVDSNYVEYETKHIRIVEYLNGDKDGILERYNLNGKIDLKKEYKGGKANGTELQYWENGKIRVKSCYNNDILNGENFVYFENGKIAAKRSWVNGKQEGKEIGYFENGKISGELTYLNGELEGKCVWYDENGNKTSEYIYHKGSYQKKCPCCNTEFWSKEGWSAENASYYARQNGGEYCCKKCALMCGNYR